MPQPKTILNSDDFQKLIEHDSTTKQGMETLAEVFPSWAEIRIEYHRKQSSIRATLVAKIKKMALDSDD